MPRHFDAYESHANYGIGTHSRVTARLVVDLTDAFLKQVERFTIPSEERLSDHDKKAAVLSENIVDSQPPDQTRSDAFVETPLNVDATQRHSATLSDELLATDSDSQQVITLKFNPDDVPFETLKQEHVSIINSLKDPGLNIDPADAKHLQERLITIENQIGAESTLSLVKGYIQNGRFFSTPEVVMQAESPHIEFSSTPLPQAFTSQSSNIEIDYQVDDNNAMALIESTIKRLGREADIPIREPVTRSTQEPARLNSGTSAIESEIAEVPPIATTPSVEEANEQDSASDHPRETSSIEDHPDPVTGKGLLYKGEKYDIEKVNGLTTVTDKTGEVIFQYSIGEEGLFIHKHIEELHAQAFSATYERVKNQDIDEIVKDPTAESQVKYLGALAPEGSHAIATAHRLLGKHEQAIRGDKFTFEKVGNGYSVYRNDPTLSPKDQTLAISTKDGIVAQSQTPQELNQFHKTYHSITIQEQQSSRPKLRNQQER